MTRRRAFVLLVGSVALMACSRNASRPTTSTAVPVAPASAFPRSSAEVPAPSVTPSADDEAADVLTEIRRAAKDCAADPQAPSCEGGRIMAREYELMHCGAKGVDPKYTFAWAAAVPLPGARPYQDDDGHTWYVESERSPKLARVADRIWSEGDWKTAEPTLRFVSPYPSEADARRLAVLDEQVKKKTRAEGIVRAVFYGDAFVGAYPIYQSLEPSLDGGMLYGFYVYQKAHPLCRTPEPHTLPAELVDFAGTWARLR